ncbi:MAG: 2-succinyl-5-enolpyruvyl-6-hydroxy-3-cyclohexene-1-carboxylic-acid synthase [Ignavibacteriaceae bacterium]|nr:2-succinyl-5-enolpyruvyl-6-hydroxy-3-cyclohexene-1-carboxylic-acid synthase [Ignavibacteriaceae bacterium]
MQINRNKFFSEALINFLASRKIQNAVLSPGSRNTPLTFAAASHKKIKTYSVIDERAAGFFATGLARSTKKPVILICTSGTAAAEYLPAVIESYFQKIPLVVITADRPACLRGTGANQTIYQSDIYGKHVLKTWDIAPPEMSVKYAEKFSTVLIKLSEVIDADIKGPVHINMQLDKPFEPDDFTDDKPQELIKSIKKKLLVGRDITNPKPEKFILPEQIAKKLKDSDKILIFCGPDAVKGKVESDDLQKLSKHLDAPVLSDGFSGIESKNKYRCVCSSFQLYSGRFTDKLKPRIIVQFGNLPVSKVGEEILSVKGITRIIVNSEGKIKGKYANTAVVCQSDIRSFVGEVLNKVKKSKDINQSPYFSTIVSADRSALDAKYYALDKVPFTEAEIIRKVDEKCNPGDSLMIGNSMPPRDFDYISALFSGNLRLFHNRGASGIDGIIASAAGIAAGAASRTFLIIGDVSFFYDLTSLNIVRQQKLNLTIILLNNGGGRIFDLLPVKRFPDMVKDFYNTPVGLDFKKLVTAFDIRYDNPITINELDSLLSKTFTGFNVIECKTSIKDSIKLRETADMYFESY